MVLGEGMEFYIERGPVFPILRIAMTEGETFRAEPGAMVSMTANIALEAKSGGKGVLGSIKAAVGGESLFTSLYTATDGAGELILAAPSPGEILEIDLRDQTVFARVGAYLAGRSELKLSAEGSMKAMLSGEGIFLSKISGTGRLFLHAYGSIIEKTLGDGEEYIVDTGHIVAFEQKTRYSVRRATKGLFSSVASGEGLVYCFQGPGRLWLQSRNMRLFAHRIADLLPQGR